MADTVKVRIKPFRGIGGYGVAGDVVEMERKLAEQYVLDGYVEMVEVSGSTSQVPGGSPPAAEAASPQMADEPRNLGGEEPVKMMEPESKRLKTRKK